MWPKVNDRRNVPKVEGAITRCPSSSWVRAVRSTSASSITSPPATIACSRVSTLRPGRWWPGRSPRSTSSSTTASTPSRSASVAVSARPALATAWWSSKATTRALGVCDDGIEKVPSEWGCMAGSQPPFSQLKGPFHNHSTAHATRRGGGSRLRRPLEGHDLIPPCLNRGEDGLLVLLMDLQFLERGLQMPDHSVERVLGDVEIGVGFVQIPTLILGRPAGNDGQQRQHVPAQPLSVLVIQVFEVGHQQRVSQHSQIQRVDQPQQPAGASDPLVLRRL